MLIQVSTTFDPKRDINFLNWLEHVKYHLKIAKCKDVTQTNAIMLLLDVDLFKATNQLCLDDTFLFEKAQQIF